VSNESSWPLVKITDRKETPVEVIERRKQCWEQWQDGAITFIEACNFLYSTITKEEMDEHLEFFPEPEFMSEVNALIERNR
jgi:hypothetical protein